MSVVRGGATELDAGGISVAARSPRRPPPEARDDVTAMVPLVRRSRPSSDGDLPLDDLAAAGFPKLVVSGGHCDGFDAICDELASRIGATRATVQGAGHEIQFTGPPLNELLLDLWRTSPQS